MSERLSLPACMWVWLLLVFLTFDVFVVSAKESALEATRLDYELRQAVVSTNGRFSAAPGSRKGMMRRQDMLEFDTLGISRLESENRNGLIQVHEERTNRTLTTPDWDSGRRQGTGAINGAVHRRRISYVAPAWAAHSSMPAMPTCTKDVTEYMGYSDYGTGSHTCTACTRACTDSNKQQPIDVKWLLSPTLDNCNAFDMKFYVNFTHIHSMGCVDCKDRGIRHKITFNVSTDAVNESGDALQWHGWMGPEVYGGPSSGAEDGYHVFEIEDTLPPDNGVYTKATCANMPNPTGRWLAVPGELKEGETFKCERVCDPSLRCYTDNPCPVHSKTRCVAPIGMVTGQTFKYHLKLESDSATGVLEGNSVVGAMWEVRAVDLDIEAQYNAGEIPPTTVGRIILVGNAATFGIKDVGQSHDHIGCVPCDLFYESTLTFGPFIDDPPNVHVVQNAEGDPPPLTTDSCELFRMSAVGGLGIRFETGPGLWPPFEVDDNLLTCSQSSSNTCPS